MVAEPIRGADERQPGETKTHFRKRMRAARKAAMVLVQPGHLLSITDVSRIKRRLNGDCNGQPSRVGFVCSDPWADVCAEAVDFGRAPHRTNLTGIERDLHRLAIYPPGGKDTSMLEDSETLRFIPPDYTKGSMIGRREDRMTLAYGCRLPRSVSAVMLDSIRAMKGRPEKKRLHTR